MEEGFGLSDCLKMARPEKGLEKEGTSECWACKAPATEKSCRHSLRIEVCQMV